MANEAFMAGFGKGKDTADKKKMAVPSHFQKGGKVKKTGMAKVHAGELVLTKSEAKGRGKSSKKKGESRKRVTAKR